MPQQQWIARNPKVRDFILTALFGIHVISFILDSEKAFASYKRFYLNPTPSTFGRMVIADAVLVSTLFK